MHLKNGLHGLLDDISDACKTGVILHIPRNAHTAHTHGTALDTSYSSIM